MVFFSATTPDQVTDLPVFNDFQMAIQSLLEGHSSEEEVSKVYQQLDVTLGQALYHYYEQVHFQPPSEDLELHSTQVYTHLDMVREESGLAFKAALSGEEEASQFHLDSAREHLSRMMEIFAQLRREEEARPKFSELSWVHELCRVAVACRQGQLSEDHLAERLETCQQLHGRASLAIPQMPPLIADRQRWGEILASVMGALESLGQGLEQVDQYLAEAHEEALDHGLDLCMSGAQRLLEELETLRELEEHSPGILCPMCSHENELSATRCSACSAVFPRLSELDEALAPAEYAWPSHVEGLLKTLESLRQGSTSRQQALAEVSELQERFKRGLQSMTQLKTPELSPEEKNMLEEARGRMIADSQVALQGLGEMLHALEQGQMDLLNAATETFLAGVQGLVESHELGQQLLG